MNAGQSGYGVIPAPIMASIIASVPTRAVFRASWGC